MGVGGVLYNGISGYFDVVTGGTSLEAGIEKSKRCAKIFTRCRHDVSSPFVFRFNFADGNSTEVPPLRHYSSCHRTVVTDS